MTDMENLSPEDKEFLTKCEEKLKDRYTEKDEEYMKVFESEPPTPPIIENWWVPQNRGQRNDRRNNRKNHPYGRRDRGYQDRGQDRDQWGNRDRRGYSDYERNNDRGGNQRPRY